MNRLTRTSRIPSRTLLRFANSFRIPPKQAARLVAKWVLFVVSKKSLEPRAQRLGIVTARFAFASLAVFVTLASILAILYTPNARVAAATNSTINFQARLLSNTGALIPDGNYHVEFKIYDSASSGTSSQGVCSGNSTTDDCWWREVRTTGNLVNVKNGYVTASLGSVTSFPANMPWDQELWLSMNIGGAGGSPSWDGEMSPRMKITAVPYAMRSAEASQLRTNNGVLTSSLNIAAPTGGNQTFQIQDQGAAGTYNLCVQGSSACGFALLSGANTFTGVNTFSAAGTALSVTNNASVGGTLTVGTGAGTGLFTNNGATLNTTLVLTNFNYSGSGNTGSIGLASDTVDKYTNIAINQNATAGQTLTIPNPTNATAGRVVYITNIGSVGYTMAGAVVSPGVTMQFIWSGTAWSLVTSGVSGSYIQNGTALQTANFNIQSNATGSVTATIQGANSQTANILEVKQAGVGTAVFSISAAGDGTFENNLTVNGNTTIGNATTDRLTVTSQLLGQDALVFQGATDDGFTTTFIVTDPTANNILTLPNESGTICTTGSVCTGYAPSATNGYVQFAPASAQTDATNNASIYIDKTSATGNLLQLQRSTSDVVSVSNTGQTLFRNTSNSATAFRVQRSTSDNIFAVETNNNRIKVGNDSAGSGADTTLFIVDTATTANRPTGVNGGIFYDTTLSKFRCYENGAYKDCDTGVTAVGAFSGSSIANGASISGSTITFGPADASNPGMVTTGAQTIAGAKTFNSLITGQAGLTVSGAAISLNDNSNFNTTINTGTSTGTVTIGSASAGAITLQSSAAINTTAGAASTISTTSGALTITSAAAATWSTTAGNLTLQAGSGTVSLGTSTALTASGALGITSGGANALTLDTGGAATLSVGTANANAISISRTGISTTVNGNLTVAETVNLNGNTTIGNATTDRLTVTSQLLGQDALVFQGATDDGFTTTFRVTDPTANNVITLPNESGTVALQNSVNAGFVIRSGDTMTGNLNMGTNKLIGGTRITDVLKLQGTTDNGTLTSPAIQLLTGNNGGTTALTVLNNGNVGIGTTTPQAKLSLGSDTTAQKLLIYDSTTIRYGLGIASGEMRMFAASNAGNGLTFGKVDATDGSTYTEQMRIQAASGNVGIGTTTPGAKLQVDTGAAATVGQIIKGASAQTADLLQIQNSAGTSLLSVASSGTLKFGSSVDGAANEKYIGGASGLYMSMNVPAAYGYFFSIANATKMAISATGDVGIGTTSPSNTLEVNKAVGTISATQLAVTNSQAGGYGAGIGFYAKQTDDGLLYEQAKITADGEQSWGTTATRSSGLRFFTVNAGTLSEKLRISAAGNVGIGTTSPAEKFVVSDTTSISLRVQSGLQNNIRFTRTAAAAGTSAIGYSSGGASGLFNGLVFSSYDGSVWRNNMYIADTGNVGIGTTTPSNILEVNKGVSTVSATQLTVANSNVGGWGAGISFTGKQTDDGLMYEQAKITADGDANWSNAAARSSSLRLFTTNAGTLSEKMRVSAAGNVGIGTTSPAAKLQVQTDTNKDVRFTSASHDTLTNLGSAITFSRPSDGSANLAGVMSWNNGGLALAGREGLAFATGGASIYNSTVERMRITASGNVGIGTTSPGAQLQVTAGAADTVGQIIQGASAQTADLLQIQDSAANKLMVVTSGGNVGIANTAPGYRLHVGSNAIVTGTSVARFENAGGTCTVTPSTAGGITCTSDIRLKKNIENIDSTDVLNKLLGLNTIAYNMNAESDTDLKHVGFSAQQLETIMPDLVVTDSEGYKSVSYSGLTPYIIAGIQAQQAKIVDAQTRLTALENSIQPSSNNILDLANGGTIQGNLNVVGNLNVTGPVTMKSLTVTGDVVIAGNLSVQNITVANITINGHIITAGNVPAAVAGAAAGAEDALNNIAAPTVQINGNDTSGTITVTAGANTTANELAKVTFSTAFTNKPRVVFSPANRDSAKIGAYYDASQATNTSFSIMTDQPPTPGTTYTFTYFIVE